MQHILVEIRNNFHITVVLVFNKCILFIYVHLKTYLTLTVCLTMCILGAQN